MFNHDYRHPWYFSNGLLQTLIISYWYTNSWQHQKNQAPWLSHLNPIPWQEHIFQGADEVPLWGVWSCPPKAQGSIIINYGITGNIQRAWYAEVLARKAYAQGWAVVLYDWRGHGKTAELSPTPPADGWREGMDQVKIAQQLIKLGCPAPVIVTGFSLGGQLALWGLKAATESNCSLIKGGAVLSPNLESSLSLAHLVSTPMGRAIERFLTKGLREEVAHRQKLFPHSVQPGTLERIDSIKAFDREIVLDYYGFASVEDYYQKTSGLYLLDQLKLPYLVVYAADDPMFAPQLIPEIQRRMATNPYGHLLMTPKGGHVCHIGISNSIEDQFWGINRLLEFGNLILRQEDRITFNQQFTQ